MLLFHTLSTKLQDSRAAAEAAVATTAEAATARTVAASVRSPPLQLLSQQQ